MSGDSARVSVTVEVPPTLAFEIFTEEIDRWWRRGWGELMSSPREVCAARRSKP
jgi:hypothetical protein